MKSVRSAVSTLLEPLADRFGMEDILKTFLRKHGVNWSVIQKKLIDEVRPHRVKYSIEPMPWMYPTGPDEYLRLEKDINREEFGIHFDFVNMINSPQRYFHINEFMQECFDKIGDRILSCHLKDIRLKRELTFQLEETNCGNGILDIEQLIQHLQNYNHDMPVIIEHLDTDEEYLKSLTYVKKRLQDANVVF